MGLTRITVALLALLVLATGKLQAAELAAPQGTTPAAVIHLTGEVDNYMRDSLFRHFREAQAAGAKTVILQIDTFGGMVTSALEISQYIRGQRDVHTIAFVDKKAISAGSMISMACDEIVMKPGSVLGDSAPIHISPAGQLDPIPPTERAKIESPVLLDFQQSCIRNGYNPLLGAAMVKVGDPVYLVQNADGKERAVDQAKYKTLLASGEWKDPAGIENPIDGPDTLLIVDPEMAARLGLSRGTFDSVKELAAQRHFNIISDYEPGFGDHVVEALNGDVGRFLLIVVFLLSLYIVLHAPGHGAAEAVAIVSLGLLVGVPMLTGFAQWWELAIIFIGLGLCAFEIFVFPGHGVSLGVGSIMFLLGLLLTFAGRDPGNGWIPTSPQALHHLHNGLIVMVGAGVFSVAAAMALRPWLPSLPIFRKLVLTETSGSPIAAAGAPLHAGEDAWPFVGTVGVATTDLRPGGVVQFPYGSDQRNAPVVCASGFVVEGSKVTVQEVRGNRIVVRAV